jgi:hypothetical protein
MYHALLQHPEVFLPNSNRPDRYWITKEPLHYCGDLQIRPDLRIIRRSDYLGLFEKGTWARRKGEASAQYLFSEEAPLRIRETCSDEVRILIMLRPPVEWMRSWHHDCLRYAHESLGDFGKALAAEPKRACGRKLPKNSGFAGCLLYRHQAHFSQHVARYFEVFGRDRVKVVLMEDLNRDHLGVLRETAEFLGISTDFDPTPERHNDSGVLSLTHLHEYRLQRKLEHVPWLNQFVPWNAFRQFSLHHFSPLSDKSIDPDLHERLVAEFEPEVERLGRLIGRDLSHWNGRPAATVAAR